MAELSGIVNVYKPVGMTSHDVVGRMRKILGIRKIGHTGTLDPDAEGVLPICVGKATKAADMLTATDKEYTARVTLGSATDTGDASGKIISSVDMDEVVIGKGDIEKAAEEFLGEIMQVPPMYSAIKVGGKKLYELARKGIEIEREPRRVRIDKIEIFDCAPSDGSVREFSAAVACSKGTYIRSLCSDLGEKLGCHAHMSGLVRTRSGRFDQSGSYTLDMIAEMAEVGDFSFLIPTDSVFEKYGAITLDERNAAMVKNGVRVRAPKNTREGEIYRVYDKDGAFLTVSKRENDRMTIIKTFY